MWRYERGRLAPLILSGDHYVEAERSLAFPNLPMGRFNEFVAIGLTDGQSAAVRALREWHREGNG